MVDLGSLVLLMSIFGAKVAVVYVILGLVIAVAGGTLIEKLHLENQVEEFIRNAKAIELPQEELTVKDRLKYSWDQVTETLKKVFPYILVGVGPILQNYISEIVLDGKEGIITKWKHKQFLKNLNTAIVDFCNRNECLYIDSGAFEYFIRSTDFLKKIVERAVSTKIEESDIQQMSVL